MKFSAQGKTCFHYREPLFSLQGSLFSLQGFPCEKTSQGNPCFHYREWVCSEIIRVVCLRIEIGLQKRFHPIMAWTHGNRKLRSCGIHIIYQYFLPFAVGCSKKCFRSRSFSGTTMKKWVKIAISVQERTSREFQRKNLLYQAKFCFMIFQIS